MNAETYNKLVSLYSDALYRFILKNTQEEAEAQDVVQESFMKLWLHRHSIKIAQSRAWLFSTAYHIMVDHIRKYKRITLLEGHHEQPTDEPEYEGLDVLLEAGLAHLPVIQKSVLLLRDYEGYNYSEIAAITQLNLGQVKVYIHRARNSLKEYVKKMENYYEPQRKEL